VQPAFQVPLALQDLVVLQVALDRQVHLELQDNRDQWGLPGRSELLEIKVCLHFVCILHCGRLSVSFECINNFQ